MLNGEQQVKAIEQCSYQINLSEGLILFSLMSIKCSLHPLKKPSNSKYSTKRQCSTGNVNDYLQSETLIDIHTHTKQIIFLILLISYFS